MSHTAQSTAQERLFAIARALQHPRENDAPANKDTGLPAEFVQKLKKALFTDPQLPQPEPTHSLWQQPAHHSVGHIQSSVLPQYTDFVVIGSGITGCSVTKTLLGNSQLRNDHGNKPHVTVVEARGLVSGATGRNGGQLVSPIGHTYTTLVRRFGKENADDMARFSIRNIMTLIETINELDDELKEACEIRQLQKVMVAQDEETWRAATASVEAFREAHPEHVTMHRFKAEDEVLETRNVKTACGAIESLAGAVWPYRLITGIFERLLEDHHDRLAIETNTPVTGIVHHTSQSSSSTYPYSVSTPRGVIRTKQVIHCTNGHAAHLLKPLIGHVYPFRNTMSVQKAGPSLENIGQDRSWTGLVKTTLDTETGMYREGLFYLQQNARTGDIWVGNEASSLWKTISGDDTTVSAEAVEALIKFLPEYFKEGWPSGELPQLRGIWTGIQGHSSDGLPLVGRLPSNATGRSGEGEWIAGAYNGYGMDKAWLTGEALAKMVAGEEAPDWLPKCFLVSEARMKEQLTVDRAIAKWESIARTGDW
ncbi:FAD dependent oxidoreductase domain-containing protein [Sarocladium implicatum]|nr:FAD dependent oxidoreductase domain-containing protein [Sarocladium implicatum]